MWIINYSVLLLVSFHVVSINRCELISDENQAREFLTIRDEAFYNSCLSRSSFDFNMSTENFTWQNFSDPVLRRAFQLIAQEDAIHNSFASLSQSNDSKRDSEIWKEMTNIFSSSGACIYNEIDKRETENCTMVKRSELNRNFSKIGNYEERKYYWIAWRDSIGKIRSIWDERMKILQRQRIFPNYNEVWIFPYEESFEFMQQELERVLQEIFPLYKELHAFVRRRLIGIYGTTTISSNGPIPSHLLGLRTNHWWNINGIAVPYPEDNINITEIIKEKNVTIFDMLKLGEDFCHSLGFPYIDDNFWNDTYFVENGYCPSHFHYTCKSEIKGMTTCIPMNEFNLHRVIGTPIQVYIANQERRPGWPRLRKELANRAFLPALKIAIELSSWTTDYLHQIGFIEDIPRNLGDVTAHDLNLLTKVALRFLATIPYAYKVMKWRWDSYDFQLSEENYNKKWWEYSLEYQGICPPVKRTEENFDPASSQELVGHIPLIGDFIGIIYGFQFYKAACEEAGHNGLIHRCNLYDEKTFGNKLRRIIYLGRSIPGPEAISLMTNGESVSMDIKPLLEYFQPLYEWLRRENEGETLGWQSDDPTQCP